MPSSALMTVRTEAVVDWYAAHARDLPWRRPGTSPWGVLVSELMLQQTPVARVEPVWTRWLARWPTPADLAADSPGEAVRAWGRLGYPRQALRLHECAGALVRDRGGAVPADVQLLRALPGVGDYTAAAVVAFAYGQRAAVLDTNVRRVLARQVFGVEQPATVGTTKVERELAGGLLPDDPEQAARWSAAAMELGALVCTARNPRCSVCPVADGCAWLRAGRPAGTRRRRTQTYAGTDRQCRGQLLAVLRDSATPVPGHVLVREWDDERQRTRALAGLVADGLVEPIGTDRYALPGSARTDLPTSPGRVSRC